MEHEVGLPGRGPGGDGGERVARRVVAGLEGGVAGLDPAAGVADHHDAVDPPGRQGQRPALDGRAPRAARYRGLAGEQGEDGRRGSLGRRGGGSQRQGRGPGAHMHRARSAVDRDRRAGVGGDDQPGLGRSARAQHDIGGAFAGALGMGGGRGDGQQGQRPQSAQRAEGTGHGGSWRARRFRSKTVFAWLSIVAAKAQVKDWRGFYNRFVSIFGSLWPGRGRAFPVATLRRRAETLRFLNIWRSCPENSGRR